jgi:hypothetical protein
LNPRLLLFGLFAGLTIVLGRLVSAELFRAARSPLVATNTPASCEVNQVRRRRVKSYPYVYYYRTEVRNNSKAPLRVVAFSYFKRVNGHWVEMPNVMKRPLVAQDFVNWYNDGDPLRDGWIAPGKTAVCDPSWSGFVRPPQALQEMKWVFTAVDKHGKRHTCEAKIDLLPVSSQHRRP